MTVFGTLFKKIQSVFRKSNSFPRTSGELITEKADGANLVDGKQTWEHADNKKHDLLFMKRCCDAELKTMKKVNIPPAPYYFERVAILSRKKKDYEQEIKYCKLYISTLEEFYKKNDVRNFADVRKGPRYQSIVKRLPKAIELLKKNR